MRRLTLKLPTILQIDKCKVLLFHEGGVSQFLRPDDLDSCDGLALPQSSSSRIWVLVDSNPRLSDPAPIFCSCRPFFVVQAKSPPWLFFAETLLCERFCMKSWTLPEILQAYVTPPSRGS